MLIRWLNAMLTCRFLWWVVVPAVVPAAPPLLWSAAFLLGFGPWWIPAAEFLLLGLFPVPVLLLALPFVAFRKSRRAGAVMLVASLAFVVGTVLSFLGGERVRMLGFRLAADRAAPVVEAVSRFEKEKGRPPRALDELVPRYLSAIPSRIPPIDVVAGEEARAHYQGNRWALQAMVRTGFMELDEFFYIPEQNYETSGTVERVGAWAVRHH